MNNTYALLVKTGESELRALQNLSSTKGILPIIELTRGRISKKDEIGDVNKKIDKISSCFKDMEIILDLTAEKSLSNTQIENLYKSDDGYSNWIEFLHNIKKTTVFKKIIPTIMLNVDDDDFENNLNLQLKNLTSSFKTIAYRCNIEDDGYADDLEIISKYVNNIDHLYFIIDNSYIRLSEYNNCRDKSLDIINNILKITQISPKTKIIITSTSFPDKKGEDYDIINLTEINLYNQIKEESGMDLIYGDYGSINPIRNDTVVMARGWRPRIDVPLEGEIYYYRRRKTSAGYSKTYSLVAEEVIEDKQFPKKLKGNWGINQIINAADGASPGSSPSFWISVRVNIHIEQQQRRLGLL
ncbi:hypothetical protein [uncultured Bacteroides sp.]|uniref:beta family protein n=1 Tax=uncultured Bacteroides sp. TaxID=162156 RepID=UPI002AABFF92|nr:hypothetical protein [uncultured Bacteroides sp.]